MDPYDSLQCPLRKSHILNTSWFRFLSHLCVSRVFWLLIIFNCKRCEHVFDQSFSPSRPGSPSTTLSPQKVDRFLPPTCKGKEVVVCVCGCCEHKKSGKEVVRQQTAKPLHRHNNAKNMSEKERMKRMKKMSRVLGIDINQVGSLHYRNWASLPRCSFK